MCIFKTAPTASAQTERKILLVPVERTTRTLVVSTHSCKRNEKCYAYDDIFNFSNFKIISIPIINYGAIVLVFSKSRNGSRICTAASRGFSLAWLLASTRSFAWLVCRIVGFIATFSIYIILWLLHKFSNICKPEEGWYGQPKYCYRKQLHVVLNQLCSSLWTSRSWFVYSSQTSHANNFVHAKQWRIQTFR